MQEGIKEAVSKCSLMLRSYQLGLLVRLRSRHFIFTFFFYFI